MRFLVLLFLLSSSAFAVESQSILNQSPDEAILVGVIRDSQENSVALIKTTNNNRSYTLKVGDELPWKKAFFVIEISGRTVVVGDGTQKSRIEPDTWASNNKFDSKSESTFDKNDDKEFETSSSALYKDTKEFKEERSLKSALEDADDDTIDTIEALIEELDIHR